MKEISLTFGYAALINDEDYELVSSRNWYVDPRKHTNYAKSWKDGKNVYLHRFILGQTDPKIKVDHKDNNGLNCQRDNLRTGTQRQNLGNSRKGKRSKSSRFKGVSWHAGGKKWQVSIRYQYKSVYLGLFKNEIDAAKAYDKAAREIFGEFALYNFPK